ncbi:hypothetical protein [Streptomyces sp. NPDC102282]|uniref:hypothetical protein n=1 Tax=Streptomyces sp. NPDC102282 TaxID=3366154 RepID=UPI003800026C
MEGIELWHTEQPLPIAARGPATEVAPNCPLAALPLTVPHPDYTLARMVWDWTPGTGLDSGEEVLVPVDPRRPGCRERNRPRAGPVVGDDVCGAGSQFPSLISTSCSQARSMTASRWLASSTSEAWVRTLSTVNARSLGPSRSTTT